MRGKLEPVGYYQKSFAVICRCWTISSVESCCKKARSLVKQRCLEWRQASEVASDADVAGRDVGRLHPSPLTRAPAREIAPMNFSTRAYYLPWTLLVVPRSETVTYAHPSSAGSSISRRHNSIFKTNITVCCFFITLATDKVGTDRTGGRYGSTACVRVPRMGARGIGHSLWMWACVGQFVVTGGGGGSPRAALDKGIIVVVFELWRISFVVMVARESADMRGGWVEKGSCV